MEKHILADGTPTKSNDLTACPPVTDLLACPACHSALTKEGSDLSCPECGERLVLKSGIYFSQADPGEIEDADDTISAFGRRWNEVYRRMGALKDFFLPSIQPVMRDFFKDKVIVDGGGGFGRLTKLMLDFGARHVVILDASDAIFAAREYLKDYGDRVTLVKGNLVQPPLRDDAFDIFLCHGVLHHTGKPETVLDHITRALKPMIGSVILWVYAEEGNGLLAKLISASQKVCSVMGDWGRWRVADLADAFFWSLTNLIYRPLDRLFGIKDKLYYGEYFMDFLYVERFSNRVDRLQMYHDFLTTKIVDYYSEPQLRGWLESRGFKTISTHFYRKQSWSVAASLDTEEDFRGRR